MTRDEIERRKIEARARLSKGRLDVLGKKLEEAESLASLKSTSWNRKIANKAKKHYCKAEKNYNEALHDKLERELGVGKVRPRKM
ncbi:hypothetical protein [Xanthomonas graminis]|uniref:hypothetical protein n=1 Tax=Xanthomonas graminis TaxID=3390026 RepID=UPI0011876304|nr:hypothetical protein [Xanthomonas translucens]UKE78475.1 hypothetical protein KM317_04370 [Xanthomonas translucens pv. arrhenatheri]